jgi:hypothetical protein
MITEGEEQKHLKWGRNWGEIVSIQVSFFEGHFNTLATPCNRCDRTG